MTSPSFNPTISIDQYRQLDSDIKNNDRVAFYVHLFEYTGSQTALLMSQTASGSGLQGGIAWNSNLLLQKLFPATYPNGGVYAFSVQVARDDRDSIQVTPDGQSAIVPSDRQMLLNAHATWKSNGLGDWFPGNGFIAMEYASTGEWQKAAEFLGKWNAFLPLVGIAAVEFFGELHDSRSNYSKSVQEVLDQNPGATQKTTSAYGTTVVTIVSKEGQTLAAFPYSETNFNWRVLDVGQFLVDPLVDLFVPVSSTLESTVGQIQAGYTAATQTLKNIAERTALVTLWKELTAGLDGSVNVVQDPATGRVTLAARDSFISVTRIVDSQGNSQYLTSKLTQDVTGAKTSVSELFRIEDSDRNGYLDRSEVVRFNSAADSSRTETLYGSSGEVTKVLRYDKSETLVSTEQYARDTSNGESTIWSSDSTGKVRSAALFDRQGHLVSTTVFSYATGYVNGKYTELSTINSVSVTDAFGKSVGVSYLPFDSKDPGHFEIVKGADGMMKGLRIQYDWSDYANATLSYISNADGSHSITKSLNVGSSTTWSIDSAGRFSAMQEGDQYDPYPYQGYDLTSPIADRKFKFFGAGSLVESMTDVVALNGVTQTGTIYYDQSGKITAQHIVARSSDTTGTVLWTKDISYDSTGHATGGLKSFQNGSYTKYDALDRPILNVVIDKDGIYENHTSIRYADQSTQPPYNLIESREEYFARNPSTGELAKMSLEVTTYSGTVATNVERTTYSTDGTAATWSKDPYGFNDELTTITPDGSKIVEVFNRHIDAGYDKRRSEYDAGGKLLRVDQQSVDHDNVVTSRTETIYRPDGSSTYNQYNDKNVIVKSESRDAGGNIVEVTTMSIDSQGRLHARMTLADGKYYEATHETSDVNSKITREVWIDAKNQLHDRLHGEGKSFWERFHDSESGDNLISTGKEGRLISVQNSRDGWKVYSDVAATIGFNFGAAIPAGVQPTAPTFDLAQFLPPDIFAGLGMPQGMLKSTIISGLQVVDGLPVSGATQWTTYFIDNWDTPVYTIALPIGLGAAFPGNILFPNNN